MQMVTAEQESFCEDYIAKKFGVSLKSRKVDGFKYIRDMPADDFKRMMTAYRAHKKRQADRENGTQKVSVELTREAYEILAEKSKSDGVTLSDALISLNNGGNLTELQKLCAIIQNLKPFNSLEEYRAYESIHSEFGRLFSDFERRVTPSQKPKEYGSHVYGMEQCHAAVKGGRCKGKATYTDNGVVLCGYHYGVSKGKLVSILPGIDTSKTSFNVISGI